MYIKKIILPVLVLFLTAFYSCSDAPSPISPEDILDKDFISISEVNSDTISQSSVYFKRVIHSGNSGKLFLGKAHNIEAGMLLDFYVAFGDTSFYSAVRNDSIIVNSATVVLNKIYEFGDTNQVVNFTAHEVTSWWDQDSLKADLPFSYNNQNLASNVSVSDSLTTFTLDNNIVLSWMKKVAEKDTNEYGIYLNPTSSGVIMGYNSLSSIVDTTQPPRVWVVYQKLGKEPDTVTLYPEENLSIITGSAEIPGASSENIFVQGGLVLNGKLWFDLSGIPENAIINSAELTLTIDTLQSITGTPFTNSVYVATILDSADLSNIDNGITLGRVNNTFFGNITPIIQNIEMRGSNQGILVRASNQTEGLELFAIKGSNAGDIAMRPHLKIIYTSKR